MSSPKPAPTLLLGHTGFVGTTLRGQTSFDHGVRSTTIHEIHGREYLLAVCAAAPAKKWIANREPEADAAAIDGIIDHLEQAQVDEFVLVSTVDVFGDPIGVDEATEVETTGLHAYGRGRRRLEEYVESRFPNRLIARLPGLVGPGLRKNVIYDLHHDNALDMVDSRGVFQFYPMTRLWHDIGVARAAGLDLVHLTAAPVSVAEVARVGFGREFENELERPPARYDMRTRHAAAWGSAGDYQYDAAASLAAIAAYHRDEPRGAGA